jgi:DNA-binding beta-propeller fold protein YncE
MSQHPLRIALSLGLAVAFGLPAMAGSNYKLVKTIDLPGAKGGHGDWVSYDSATDTIWLAQSPDHNVVVIDAKKKAVKGVIPGIANGNGIALTAKYAFLADGDGNDVVVVDKWHLKQVATLKPEGKTPDGIVFVAKAGTIYVTSDDSNDITVFKASPPFAEAAHIQLQPDHPKDGPDVPAYVESKNRVFQPDDAIMNVIDTTANKVETIWKPDVKGDVKPMVYDQKTDHLFVGTTDKKLLVLNADSGDLVATIPLKGSVDETAIDAAARRAYVGDKAGAIEVIDLDKDAVIDWLPSEKNVHTLAVDTKTHDVYVYRNQSNKVDVFRLIATM